MTEQDLLRLIHFYRGCVEAEDRRSLTKKLSALHHSLVSPWDEEEAIFHPEAAEILFDANLSSDRKVISAERGRAMHGSTGKHQTASH